jgi:hypothetical protein
MPVLSPVQHTPGALSYDSLCVEPPGKTPGLAVLLLLLFLFLGLVLLATGGGAGPITLPLLTLALAAARFLVPVLYGEREDNRVNI